MGAPPIRTLVASGATDPSASDRCGVDSGAKTRMTRGVMSEPTAIRVFVVDDHEMVRRGLISLFEGEAGFDVVGEAAGARSAVARIQATSPDVVLLDVRLQDGNGVEVCREVRSSLPEVAVLMITSYTDERAEFDAAVAGAAGYFIKDVAGEELLAAVRRAASGEVLIDRTAVHRPPAGQGASDPTWATLSPQEKRVLDLIGRGYTNRQIGEELFLSEKTVKHYVTSLLRKLSMQRRTQAASFITHLQDQGLGGAPTT